MAPPVSKPSQLDFSMSNEKSTQPLLDEIPTLTKNTGSTDTAGSDTTAAKTQFVGTGEQQLAPDVPRYVIRQGRSTMNACATLFYPSQSALPSKVAPRYLPSRANLHGEQM